MPAVVFAVERGGELRSVTRLPPQAEVPRSGWSALRIPRRVGRLALPRQLPWSPSIPALAASEGYHLSYGIAPISAYGSQVAFTVRPTTGG
ncbi:hypothetical protein P8605_04670 [Streptomyces sp. T-3]|nr:hypothetical protein [Streptomyces sp. T-3]